MNFRVMPKGYGKASKEIQCYITKLEDENIIMRRFFEGYIVVKDKPYEEGTPYILCNAAKQDLYKTIYNIRNYLLWGKNDEE